MFHPDCKTSLLGSFFRNPAVFVHFLRIKYASFGRTAEKEILDGLLKSPTAELLVVYGRISPEGMKDRVG